MKHPNREQWMDYLYGELPDGQRGALEAHLRDCGECQAQLSEWDHARQALDAWKLARPAPARKRASVPAWIIQAAAAAIVALAAFGAGRWASPAPNVEALRAQLEPALRQQLRREMASAAEAQKAETRAALAQLVRALDQQRQEDRQSTLRLLKDQENRQTENTLALRRDLETVAVLTDGGLRSAQDQIVRLASWQSPPRP